MRVVAQRVLEASVTIEGELYSKIGKGLLLLVGADKDDTIEDIKYMGDKILGLRIFEDSEDKMNLSVMDVEGEILAVSQFTLLGDCRRGRRPSFSQAGNIDVAREHYNQFVEYLKANGAKVETGVFQADMQVGLINDGPVTMLLDSKKVF